MCVPGCNETLAANWSRRGFFKGVVAAAMAAGATRIVAATGPAQGAEMKFSSVRDLTHTLYPDFPTYFGPPGLEIENVYSFDKNGFNLNKWHLNEHTGTHMDAPLHFSKDGPDAAALEVEKLVVPLAIVNIAARAEGNADAEVTPDDLKAWEAKNGALPDGCCIAMYSGWEKHLATDKFRNADAAGALHFPGFHVEASAMLLERNVVGMAVDTLSLDYGASKDFKTHYLWLPTGRWGLENVANLGDLPEVGSTLVVGGPKIKGATGGPSRLMALV
jgi:kynurenine formamidase